MREIRPLRVMWRELETGPGGISELPRQFPTLPGDERSEGDGPLDKLDRPLPNPNRPHRSFASFRAHLDRGNSPLAFNFEVTERLAFKIAGDLVPDVLAGPTPLGCALPAIFSVVMSAS